MISVYIAEIPFLSGAGEIFPQERRKETEACGSESLKAQKLSGWRLLGYAVKETFGWEMRDLHFEKTPNGKWTSKEFEFSLTHSGNLVAVAVSKQRVGIDAEKIDLKRFDIRLRNRILTAREKERLQGTEEERARKANLLWTKKEAIFKMNGFGAFFPAKIETEGSFSETKELNGYFVTVVSPDKTLIEFYIVNIP